MRELADQRRRFGYRRLGYLLAREGMTPNHKKLLRIYREENLRVRRRGGRKRALGTRSPMVLPKCDYLLTDCMQVMHSDENMVRLDLPR